MVDADRTDAEEQARREAAARHAQAGARARGSQGWRQSCQHLEQMENEVAEFARLAHDPSMLDGSHRRQAALARLIEARAHAVAANAAMREAGEHCRSAELDP